MLALIAKVGGYVIFPDVKEFRPTDDQIFRAVEKSHGQASTFCRHDWTVFRGRDWAPDNYALNTWEVWATAAIRRVVHEVGHKHEVAFWKFVESLGEFPPPDPPAPYRDPYATIEWQEP